MSRDRQPEKIRFRRDEIASLGALPSAAPPALRLKRMRRRRRRSQVNRIARYATVLVGCLAIALFLLTQFGVPASGIERLRAQAERVASRFAGQPINATLGPMGVSFSQGQFLALDVRNVSMASAVEGGPQIEAGEVRFGLRLMPLLTGEIRLGNAALSDARIVAGALNNTGERDWAADLKNDQGLIDPDKVLAASFEGLRRALSGLDAGQTRDLELENVEVVLPGAERTTRFVIRQATLLRTANGLAMAGEVDVNGRIIVVDGKAIRAEPSGRITDLAVSVNSAPVERAAPLIKDGSATVDPSLGTLNVSITGAEGADGEKSRLSAEASMSGAAIDLGKNGVIEGRAALALELVEGSGRLAIRDATLETGQTDLAFSGHFGPRAAKPGQIESYGFELASASSTLAAAASHEAPLNISSTVSGIYEPTLSRLTLHGFRLTTSDGAVNGKGAVQFEGRRAPGIALQIDVDAMPVAYAKQIWPFFIARGARNWVLENVTAGRLDPSAITLAIAPGRLGDGVPLKGTEANGRFGIAEGGFRIVGELPPVEAAYGSVAFSGSDVDITIDSGIAHPAPDRPVTISGGKLLIPSGQPEGRTVGRLTLDLSGEARAVTDVASRKPIDGLRTLGVAPADFAGDIWGTIEADIPLSRGIDPKTLTWRADLAFDRLALAKPLAGQKIAAASGTAVIDQSRATISGKAELNGLPAELEIVEPVGDKTVERQRLISLVLDEPARKKAFPALDPLLGGPLVLKVDASGGSTQGVKGDLTQTEIRLPWLGWSKGAGVAADLSFDLAQKDGATRLQNFRLDGESFIVGGTIDLDQRGLASADFSTVRLNRDDRASVTLKRDGKGFRIRARGERFDARPLVKQYLASSASAEPSQGAPVPVTIDAAVDRAGGFFGETASNIRVSYDASGLRVSGVIGKGGAVALSTTAGNSPSVKLQSTDAGSLLRFVDLYEFMRGGRIEMALTGRGTGTLTGAVEARDFRIVNEPKLASLVANAPAENRAGDRQQQAEVESGSVTFERGFTRVEKGPGTLRLAEGIVRGPLIGASFQGTFYDQAGNMDMTGTFLPVYGVNRIFGEIPLIGQILGNGRDRALIGITFRLAGNAKTPDLQINPLSAVAPGIFRSIFEF